MTPVGGRAVVVGGSLGGLNAALWLRDIGWDVVVLERSASPLEGRGAGIVLHPSTARYLVDHGIADLTEISTPVTWLRYLGPDSTVLSQTACRFRFTSWTTLYRSLLGCLDPSLYQIGTEVASLAAGDGARLAATSAVKRETSPGVGPGPEFRSGLEPAVESVAGGAGPAETGPTGVGVAGAGAGGAGAGGQNSVGVLTTQGNRLEADLVVAADGVASTVRSLLFPDVLPHYTGYVGWRGTAGEDQLSAGTLRGLRGSITYHLMPASHILAYPIPGGDFNWVWYRNVAEGGPLDDLMTGVDGRRHPLSLPPGMVQSHHVEELRSAAKHLPGPLAEMVLATAEPFVQLIVDVAVPRMVVGRVCILGDAAFALRPHAAVGTAKAAEDAWQLARALDATGDVDRALATWEEAQLRLGRQVAARTCQAGNRSQFEGTWEVGEPLPFGLYEIGDSAFEAS